MEPGKMVAVIGAYGHTGRFVVAQLRQRGYGPLLVGRDVEKLRDLAAENELQFRFASVNDAGSLDRALRSVAAVINCAGPFTSTAAPVIEAALRLGIPYVDVAAEVEVIDEVFAEFTDRVREAEGVVVPAMAFYGGLGDLLATHAMRDWTSADEAEIAYGLSSWYATSGTLATTRESHSRRGGKSVRFREGKLEYHSEPSTTSEWSFPKPIGTRPVINELTMADAVTFARHAAVPNVRTHMSANAIQDLLTPDIPPPTSIDEHGRSAQEFVVDARVRINGEERQAAAKGKDIYAITAPLAVEATHRILTGQIAMTGLATAGEIFDATDFLRSLSSRGLLEIVEG